MLHNRHIFIVRGIKMLEEIKKRSKEITEYMHPADKAETYRIDVLYLLSIIEQAGNDLNETIDLMIGDRHGEAWERTHETYKLLRTGYK